MGLGQVSQVMFLFFKRWAFEDGLMGAILGVRTHKACARAALSDTGSLTDVAEAPEQRREGLLTRTDHQREGTHCYGIRRTNKRVYSWTRAECLVPPWPRHLRVLYNSAFFETKRSISASLLCLPADMVYAVSYYARAESARAPHRGAKGD